MVSWEPILCMAWVCHDNNNNTMSWLTSPVWDILLWQAGLCTTGHAGTCTCSSSPWPPTPAPTWTPCRHPPCQLSWCTRCPPHSVCPQQCVEWLPRHISSVSPPWPGSPSQVPAHHPVRQALPHGQAYLLQHVEHVPHFQAASGRGQRGCHVLSQGKGTALPANHPLGGGHVWPGVVGRRGGGVRVRGWRRRTRRRWRWRAWWPRYLRQPLPDSEIFTKYFLNILPHPSVSEN